MFSLLPYVHLAIRAECPAAPEADGRLIDILREQLARCGPANLTRHCPPCHCGTSARQLANTLPCRRACGDCRRNRRLGAGPPDETPGARRRLLSRTGPGRSADPRPESRDAGVA